MNLLLVGQFGPADEAAWCEALAPALARALPGHRLLRRRDEVAPETITAALVANPPAGALAGLPNLGFIQSLWAGVDRLLGDASVPPQIPLARMVDPAMSAAMAETALWAVLSLHRGFFRYAQQQRAGLWQPLPQRRADECRVLVLGRGEMGRCSAQALAAAGYPVRHWQRADGPQALAPRLAEADVLVNLLPLTPATRGLLDARLFAALPRGAAVVNLARGAHVVDADLLAALARGQVGHAVLDVFHQEPLPAGHAFWTHPQVTLLPHAAAQTDPRTAAEVAAGNLAAWAAGRTPRFLVDRSRGY